MTKKHALYIKRITEGLLGEWLCEWENCTLSTTSQGIVLTWRLKTAGIPWRHIEEKLAFHMARFASRAVDFGVHVAGSNLYIGPFRNNLARYARRTPP